MFVREGCPLFIGQLYIQLRQVGYRHHQILGIRSDVLRDELCECVRQHAVFLAEIRMIFDFKLRDHHADLDILLGRERHIKSEYFFHVTAEFLGCLILQTVNHDAQIFKYSQCNTSL